VPNGGEDSDFIECVLLLLVREVMQLYFLQGVFLAISNPLNAIY
jgi:hypothetical protein